MVLGDPDATVESYRAVCLDVLETGEQQERLIDALLTLARSQRGLDRRQPLDLAVITTEVVHSRQPAAAAQKVRFDVSVRPAVLSGDPHLVERLVGNLVDNAMHYNLPGGNVHVLVDSQGGQARLKVTNTGPVVPPEQLGRLLQPFQRLATDRAGNRDGLGLGLSIVQAITTAHGADLTLRPGDAGGLDVEVRFLAPPDSSGNRPAHIQNRPANRIRLPRGSHEKGDDSMFWAILGAEPDLNSRPPIPLCWGTAISSVSQRERVGRQLSNRRSRSQRWRP